MTKQQYFDRLVEKWWAAITAEAFSLAHKYRQELEAMCAIYKNGKWVLE